MLDVLEIRLYMIISFLCNHREEKVHVRTKFAFVRIFFVEVPHVGNMMHII
jgi:hypothetical protein